MSDAPKDNLFRGRPGIDLRQDETRDDAADSTVMSGHFAVFNEWTEINSWFEGQFLERLAPGAFAKTFRESLDRVKVQFDHGYDFHVGDSPLGPIDVAREDEIGAYYEVPLLDTDYNRDRLLPLLRGRLMSGEDRGSLLGASFRFRVIRDEWDREPGESDSNPDGLPERTIREVQLYEFGPVVFPAYPNATAGMRSLTDHYLDRQREHRRSAQGVAADQPVTAPAIPVAPALSHSMDPPSPRQSLTSARNTIQLLKLRGGVPS